MTASVVNWSISRGTIVGPGKVNFLTFPRNVGDPRRGIPTQVVGWSGQGAQNFMVEWEAKAICYAPHPSPHLVVVGPFGDAKILSPAGISDASLSALPDGPLVHGPLTEARFIGEHLYVSGIHRQIYRRESGQKVTEGTWMRCDAGLLVPQPSDAVLGITSLDGFSEAEIYAVGWQGEIWFGRPNSWSRVEPFTNLKFERVVCAPNGTVYAVGQAGLIASGRGSSWSLVDQSVTTDNFWGCAWFLDRLWFCSHSRLYVLDGGDMIVEVREGIPDGATFGWLAADNQQLWSFGNSTLMYSSNGRQWQQVILEHP